MVEEILIHLIKMRLFVILTIMFGQRCFAQTSISIVPLIINKVQTCSYGGDDRFSKFYTEQSSQEVINPYYTFKAKKFKYSNGSISIGLKIDMSFKNGNQRLGIEWATDGAGTTSKTYNFASTNTVGYTLPLDYKTYSIATSYNNDIGFTYNRISIRYEKKITKKSSVLDLFIVPEISMTYGSANMATLYYYNDSISNNSTFFHNDAKELELSIQSYRSGRKSILFGLGLRADFKLKKKNIYLFSFDVGFKQGIRIIHSAGYKRVIYDSGKTFGIYNELVSRGSGLYFQISRSFTLFRFKKKPIIQ